MSEKAIRTLFIDIDGTLVKYMGGGHKQVMHQPHALLPGVLERRRLWEAPGHNIILTTGRRESVRERTESELQRLGIPYDTLLMGLVDGGRVVINDIGSVGNKAFSVNLVRDAGWGDIDWNNVGLDNPYEM